MTGVALYRNVVRGKSRQKVESSSFKLIPNTLRVLLEENNEGACVLDLSRGKKCGVEMRRKENGGSAGQYEGQQSSALRNTNAAELRDRWLVRRPPGTTTAHLTPNGGGTAERDQMVRASGSRYEWSDGETTRIKWALIPSS